MSIRSILGFVAALALIGSFAPALASADNSYFNYDHCNTYSYNYSNTYPYNNQYGYPSQYNTCPHGTLFVYVQVNTAYNQYDRHPQDFSVSVVGNQVSKPSFPGSDKGTTIYLNGAYNVTVSPFQGYIPSYSPGCTGSVGVNTQATCIITENPTNMPYFPQYPYMNPGYGYNTPTVYVTPTYVPRLPNTGFEPKDGAAFAFAIVALIAMAVVSYPYVRKAFATLLG